MTPSDPLIPPEPDPAARDAANTAELKAGNAELQRKVDELARANEELRQSHELLRLITDSLREYAVVSMDLERRVTSWNTGAQRLLGYSTAEMLGQPADVIFTPEDRAAGVPAVEGHTAMTKGSAADERWHLRKNGARFWGSGSMLAMQDARGEVIGLVKIFRDQTAEREAKRALEQSRADLLAASQAKDHFLAVLSHELRTPLTPVLMATEVLGRRTDLPADVPEILEMIRHNVRTEAGFIDDLLDVTRIERGKLEIVRAPVDFHAALQRAVAVAQGDLQEKEQTLQVELRAQETQIHGEARRLEQVLWNLLKNAAKFSPTGGEIRLETWNEPGRIVAAVSDRGIGIEAPALGTIFESFSQENREITRQFGGLGLGLAIAKAIVDAHGGSLRAESAGRDCGAKFTVQFPLAVT